ncbi:oligodendrocyte transcription factor 1-like, partial [Schistocerca nitens]|uniref:oligodendrocyte transcription factor 1-like n=1 Tax=Schistocerca nitens TaxID=7011 RepID=UPI002119226F
GGGGGGGGRGRGGRRAKRKPPPLSRYRRRTANARERERMREINAAFEALRRAVPPHAAAYRAEDAASGFYTGSDDGSEHQQRSGEKVTKIATLRLAMSYIAELTRSLEAVSASSPAAAPPLEQRPEPAAHAAPLPPVSTLCRPQTLLLPPPAAPAASATAAASASAAFLSCLTPPLSLTPCSSSALPELCDALTPPDLCAGLTVDLALTPPPGLDEHCLTPH